MTFPLLLVALCLASLVLASAIGGWVGHARPAPAEAQRVTDAVERAALGQVVPSLPAASAVTLLTTVGGGLYAASRDIRMLWFVLAPILAALTVLAVLYFGIQRLIRASGQLVGITNTDGAVSLSARSALSTALACDAAMGLLILGVWAAAGASVGPSAAKELPLLTALSAGLVALMIARSASVASATSDTGARQGKPDQVHSGSLAALVSHSFGYSLVRSSALIAVSALGRATLLILSRNEGDQDPWVYPHLLQSLGTLAIAFGFMTVRSSEREPGAWAWLRGAAVTFVLLVAGAWSLSEGLAPGVAKRAIPSAATFFFVGSGIAAWTGGIGGREELGWTSALRKLPTTAIVLTLVAVLLIAIPETLVEQNLKAAEIAALILSSSLSVLPVAYAWQLGDGLFRSARGCSLLATEGLLPVDTRRRATDGPGRGLLGLAPALWTVVCLVATTAMLPTALEGFQPLLFGLSAALGACLMLGSSALNLKAARGAARALSALVISSSSASATEAPNLTRALDAVQKAAWTHGLIWPVLQLSPAALLGLVAWFASPATTITAGFGLASGSVLTGLTLNLVLDHAAAEELQTEGALATPLTVCHLAWAATLIAVSSQL